MRIGLQRLRGGWRGGPGDRARGGRGSRPAVARRRQRPDHFSPGYADLPAEVALRLLGRAVTRVGNEGPVELGKLEALHAALSATMAQKSRGARFRRTLAGALVMFTGETTVERAPARRSGTATGARPRKGAFTKAR